MYDYQRGTPRIIIIYINTSSLITQTPFITTAVFD